MVNWNSWKEFLVYDIDSEVQVVILYPPLHLITNINIISTMFIAFIC